MKAILLAAGLGRRMRPLTDREHKTLLTIDGRTIIGRIVDGLVANQIDDIVVATGYLADRLRAYLEANYPRVHFTFVVNPHYETTNNIHSLALVFDTITIDTDILLIESDLIYEPDVLEKLIRSPAENAALVDRHRNGMDGTVVTVSDRVITSIIPPHLQGPSFDYSDKFKTLNIYKFSEKFCNETFRNVLKYYAMVIDRSSYYEWVLGILIYVQKATIHAEVLDGQRWAEMDDPNDLDVAGFAFDEGGRLDLLKRHCGGYWNYDVLDFCFIRNMHFPTPAVLSELRSNLPDVIANYGSTQEILNQKLSYFLLCEPQDVVLLNGASQAFPLLRRYFDGRRVLVPRPTFGEFARAFPDADTYDDRGDLDVGAFEDRARLADVVVFVNPNNPSGSFLSTDWILDFAARRRDKVVILDESFIDFAPTPSAIDRLAREPLGNVIVLKSLSKALGVPGLRLGFSHSSDRSFHRFVMEHTPIWNANSLAENFLEVILKHREALDLSFRRTIRDREDFAHRLRALECVDRVFESAANFLLVRLRGDAASAHDLTGRLLAASKIYVKDASDKLGDGRAYLRLAVRLPEENERLIDALVRQWVPPAPSSSR